MKNTRAQRITGLEKSGIGKAGVTRRIVAAYRAADAETVANGTSWYSDALDFAIGLSEDTDTDIDRTVAVIAAYSPQCFWQPNKRAAALFLSTGRKASGILGESHERAQRVMCTANPLDALIGTKGPKKIHAFARNILGDTDAVTIDTWAVRVALGTDRDDHEKILARVGVYQDLAQCYRNAARIIGVAPSTVQAVTWCAIRGKHT